MPTRDETQHFSRQTINNTTEYTCFESRRYSILKRKTREAPLDRIWYLYRGKKSDFCHLVIHKCQFRNDTLSKEPKTITAHSFLLPVCNCTVRKDGLRGLDIHYNDRLEWWVLSKRYCLIWAHLPWKKQTINRVKKASEGINRLPRYQCPVIHQPARRVWSC